MVVCLSDVSYSTFKHNHAVCSVVWELLYIDKNSAYKYSNPGCACKSAIYITGLLMLKCYLCYRATYVKVLPVLKGY